jgi:hypothetical protein
VSVRTSTLMASPAVGVGTESPIDPHRVMRFGGG